MGSHGWMTQIFWCGRSMDPGPLSVPPGRRIRVPLHAVASHLCIAFSTGEFRYMVIQAVNRWITAWCFLNLLYVLQYLGWCLLVDWLFFFKQVETTKLIMIYHFQYHGFPSGHNGYNQQRWYWKYQTGCLSIFFNIMVFQVVTVVKSWIHS